MTTKSLLVGAIWQVKDNVTVDAGLRGERFGNHTGEEIRLGVTFAFAMK